MLELGVDIAVFSYTETHSNIRLLGVCVCRLCIGGSVTAVGEHKLLFPYREPSSDYCVVMRHIFSCHF